MGERQPAWYTASQAATALAVTLGLAVAVGFTGGLEFGLLQFIDLFAVGLTALLIIWTLLRIAWHHPLWTEAHWPAFERILLGAIVVGTTVLASGRIVSGAAMEFGAS